MNYTITHVGKPRGFQTGPLDNRLYSITAINENGTSIQTDVPVCFTKKSIKIHLDRCMCRRDKEKEPVIKVGDTL